MNSCGMEPKAQIACQVLNTLTGFEMLKINCISLFAYFLLDLHTFNVDTNRQNFTVLVQDLLITKIDTFQKKSTKVITKKNNEHYQTRQILHRHTAKEIDA